MLTHQSNLYSRWMCHQLWFDDTTGSVACIQRVLYTTENSLILLVDPKAQLRHMDLQYGEKYANIWKVSKSSGFTFVKIPSVYADDTSSGRYAEFRELKLFSERYFWVWRQELDPSHVGSHQGFWNQSAKWREITQSWKHKWKCGWKVILIAPGCIWYLSLSLLAGWCIKSLINWGKCSHQNNRTIMLTNNTNDM